MQRKAIESRTAECCYVMLIVSVLPATTILRYKSCNKSGSLLCLFVVPRILIEVLLYLFSREVGSYRC